jgi:hypothetical protein
LHVKLAVARLGVDRWEVCLLGAEAPAVLLDVPAVVHIDHPEVVQMVRLVALAVLQLAQAHIDWTADHQPGGHYMAMLCVAARAVVWGQGKRVQELQTQ